MMLFSGIGSRTMGERVFCKGGTRPPSQTTIQFIEDRRGNQGAEPICRVLPIVLATFYDDLAKRANPLRRSDRARRDEELKLDMSRVALLRG